MSNYLLSFQEINESQVAVVGGKGAHLGELSRIEGIRAHRLASAGQATEAFRRIMA